MYILIYMYILAYTYTLHIDDEIYAQRPFTLTKYII